MKLFVKLFVIVLISFGLTACASFRNHTASWARKSDTAYLKAKASPSLRVPSDLSRSKVGDNFSVPDAGGHGKVPASIKPPGGVYKAKVPGNPKASKQKASYFLKPLF